MKKIFIFVAIVISVITAAQAKILKDTVNANKVSYQPAYNGKVLHIAKGDTAFISGVDSVVVLTVDSVKNSEKDAVYANGKVKFTKWCRRDSKLKADPKSAGKFVFIAIGGDANTPGDPSLALGYWLAIIITVCLYFVYQFKFKGYRLK